jgi:hypothetical protein
MKTIVQLKELRDRNSTILIEWQDRLVNENDLNMRWWIHQQISFTKESIQRLTKSIEVLNGKD